MYGMHLYVRVTVSVCMYVYSTVCECKRLRALGHWNPLLEAQPRALSELNDHTNLCV